MVFPLLGSDGLRVKRSGYVKIPGVTTGEPSGHWSPGAPQTYYSGPAGDRIVLVASTPFDVWLAWQHMRRYPPLAALTVICSSDGSRSPAEWQSLAFWDRWVRVYTIDPRTVPPALKGRVRALSFRAARTPTTLASALAHGLSASDFHDLLENAPLADQERTTTPSNTDHPSADPERRNYDPVEIRCGSFIRGKLYYPIDTVIQTHSNGAPVEKVETVVVTSDRRLLTPSHVGSICRLGDLTVAGVPRASPWASWRWRSVRDFLRGRAPTKDLASITNDVLAFLQRTVWLPQPTQFILLAFAVVTSYAQLLFDSVPLLLVTGPRSSGKTLLGRAMALVAANSCVIGAASAAAIARQIDEACGLVVFDDIEAIGPKSKDPQLSPLVQTLKLGCNRTTARKTWADPRTFQSRQLDLFGVKIIYNTVGCDPTLASRAFRIFAEPMPPTAAEALTGLAACDREVLRCLRDEMHCWVFAHVHSIVTVYRRIASRVSDRFDEIAAPFRVLAELTGDQHNLEDALADQRRLHNVGWGNPDELLQVAAQTLIRAGYFRCSPTHLALEMRRISMGTSTDTSEWKSPEWVGRAARRLGVFELNSAGERRRLFGVNLRIYPFSPDLIRTIESSHLSVKAPTAFCLSCIECIYRASNCPIMLSRQKK